jgi:hypothetical protein
MLGEGIPVFLAFSFLSVLIAATLREDLRVSVVGNDVGLIHRFQRTAFG